MLDQLINAHRRRSHARPIGPASYRRRRIGPMKAQAVAAALALMARDRGGPRLAGQMLMCLMLDYTIRQLTSTP